MNLKAKRWVFLIIALLILNFVFLYKYGDHMNEKQTFGTLSVAIMFIIFSGLLFLFGTLSLKNIIFSKRKYNYLFYVGLAGFILSFLPIPLLVALTGRFPPETVDIGVAIFITTLVGLSMVLPVIPRIILTIKVRK